MSDLVSIIVPAYNAEKFLYQTLKSVIDQSYPFWECILVDDGSTDKTASIGKAMAIQDERIKYYYKANGGLSSTRNHGIKLATGKYLQFLDADDILLPGKLEVMITKYRALETENIVLFCDFQYGSESDVFTQDKENYKLFNDFSSQKVLDFNYVYAMWDKKITIPIHTFLFPVSIVKDTLFNVRLASKEDWNFHLEILSKGVSFQPVDYNGCIYRVGRNSMSKDFTSLIMASISVLSAWKQSFNVYILRISYYLLQAYIYRVKGNRISLKSIFNHLLKVERNNFMIIVIANLLIPVNLIEKLAQGIRIRLK